jgi:COP9 signalosome complex subunit 2
MCTETKNNKRLKRIYPKTTNLNSVISDPRVMGIIKECGGKMFMAEKRWDKALEELFESFKNFQDCGNSRARDVLKITILASILASSNVDYAGTREAKVFKGDEQIIAVINLRTAVE